MTILCNSNTCSELITRQHPQESGHYNNTVILFMSDNGGRAVPGGDSRSSPNHPLRGSKGSVYEGGTKVPGFIHSPLLGAASGTRYGPWSPH